VTITVKFDSCHSGGFKEGDKDLQHEKNSNGEEYGPGKIAIETACAAENTTSEWSYELDGKK
jgi:hypothetical protein